MRSFTKYVLRYFDLLAVKLKYFNKTLNLDFDTLGKNTKLHATCVQGHRKIHTDDALCEQNSIKRFCLFTSTLYNNGEEHVAGREIIFAVESGDCIRLRVSSYFTYIYTYYYTLFPLLANDK